MTCSVVLDGDGAAEDLRKLGYEMLALDDTTDIIRFAYLSGGMQSGKPAVAIILPLPFMRRYVIAQLSATLFVQAAAAIAGRAQREREYSYEARV